MPDPRLRVFVENGPRGGEWVTIEAGSDGAPPPRIELLDPAVAQVVDDNTSMPLPPAQRKLSTYERTGVRHADGSAVYRWSGPTDAPPTRR
ncbi:hypothetical protein [Pseudonocardia acidicola]|uniref:Uncharacterized protein n=1 Tax=Pseudonocardia acidicola TaxID=2724939 RepID=A0ABX1SDC5_9PSEU|nr:hypothetical protein [Pseudonocardia acidicola]NMH98532.1 hypothetical protein [Pseudonocardia acidicola]